MLTDVGSATVLLRHVANEAPAENENVDAISECCWPIQFQPTSIVPPVTSEAIVAGNALVNSHWLVQWDGGRRILDLFRHADDMPLT